MNDVIEQILADPMVATIGWSVGAGLAALWLAAAWWAYSDAAHRTGSIPAALLAAAWILASTPLLLPLSVPVYALVRPAESARERRTRRLAAELATVLEEAAGPECLSCSAPVDPAWQRCPTCTTWLALPCAACQQWSDRTLEICPYCGSEDRTEPAIGPMEPAAASAQRRLRRRVRPVGPGRDRDRALGRDSRRAATDGRPLAPLRVG